MSQRAIDFLNRWTTEHVNAVPYPGHSEEAQRLAKECIAEAKKAGISEEELEGDLTQDLVSELEDRLETRADEEIARQANRDD